MFRQPFQTKPQIKPPTEPVAGFIYSVNQSTITFGSNRKTPVTTRPVLPIRQRDQFVSVLPITSKKSNDHTDDFYQLEEQDIRWRFKNTQSTFIYHIYQTIFNTELNGQLAVISQHARMDIAHWLDKKQG